MGIHDVAVKDKIHQVEVTSEIRNPLTRGLNVKNKQTETKLKPALSLARHLFGSVLCLGAFILSCSSASAQNLFATDYLSIDEFTPDGVPSTFASGLNNPLGLAFDRVGNLFVAAGFSFVNNENLGTVYKFTPTGVRTTFASGLNSPFALAFDSQGNLFVADQGYGYDVLHDAAVYKFTPSGLRSTVASENDQVPVIPSGLAIDGADNLFVSEYWISGNTLKFTPSGVRTIFAAGSYVTAMAFQPNPTPTPSPTPTPI